MDGRMLRSKKGAGRYREPLKNASQVVWNWVKKLRFVYLLQPGERNFFTPHSDNLGRAF